MAGLNLSFRLIILLYVLTAMRFCYANNNRTPTPLENVEIQKILNNLNKPPVKSINSPDGDIIDCVLISHQPAFDHPLLKNHTIKMRPSYHPTRINKDDIKVSSLINASMDGRSLSSSVTQLWHSNGKCPKGTIPIRRTKKEDIIRATSVSDYGKKKSFPVNRSSLVDVELAANTGHEYAVASTSDGQFYGSKASFNLWKPYVQESNEFSLAQTWIVGGSYASGDLNTIEAGWQVFQGKYGDNNPRFFIYWTSDAYQKTGCYNLCPGFVQLSNKHAIGASYSTTSQLDGTQYELTILIWKDKGSGDWWLQLNGDSIGYWPSSLFTNLRSNARQVQWGGEVINLGTGGRHTTTQMGSGKFPGEWYRKASYIRNIETVDGSNTLNTPDVSTLNQQNCYDIVTDVDTGGWGRYFFFGGPGRNDNCP